MGFFDFLKTEKNTFGDLTKHPNVIKDRDRLELARDIVSKSKMIVELQLLTQQLTQNEIANWRQANQYALNIENPKRINLYQIYYDAMLDDHLLGAIRNRKLKVMRTSYKVIDQAGKENPEMTKLIQGKWMKKFMSLALDSIFYGHSLIQMGDIVREPRLKFVDVELLPREHVVPEFHVVIKDRMDDPKAGFDYLKPPFSDWVISVGEPKDLGLLLAVSKDAISKKYALQFWDQFAELFGMPIRIGKSSSRNKKDIDNIEAMLESMGSAAWALFPEGTEIEIKETTRGDAFNVYDKRIQRANSEMSKAILGQTMTMDDGSSQSQAVVHAEVAEYISEADADFLKDVINDDLFPMLIKHGWPLQNFTFDWDETYSYTPGEMKEIEAMLLDHYQIDTKYFEEKYNIKITGIKQAIQLVSEKKKPIQLSRPSYIDYGCCGIDHDDHFTLAKPTTDNSKVNESLLRLVWDNKKAVYSYEYFNYLQAIYLHALTNGWQGKTKLELAGPGINLDFETPDYKTLQMFEMNIYSFSAGKSAEAVRELNALAKDNDTFSEFKKQAEDKILTFYNGNALKAEYNHAWATSQNAAEYHRLVELKDKFPTWQYVTVGDERVRPAHKVLNGLKFRADDPAWDTIYPPNGWNCRCYVKPLSGVPAKYSTKQDAIKALAGSQSAEKASELDVMIKGGFDKNRAKSQTIFDVNKAYAKREMGKELNYANQGLQPADQLNRSGFSELVEKATDLATATKLLVDNKNLFTDYAKRTIAFKADALNRNKKALNLVESVQDVLKTPDEVFMTDNAEGKAILLNYVKHFKTNSLLVEAEFVDESLEIKSWMQSTGIALDKKRTGILIKK